MALSLALISRVEKAPRSSWPLACDWYRVKSYTMSVRRTSYTHTHTVSNVIVRQNGWIESRQQKLLLIRRLFKVQLEDTAQKVLFTPASQPHTYKKPVMKPHREQEHKQYAQGTKKQIS